jgi:hypothetical protein
MPYWLAKTSEMVAMDRWFSYAGGTTEAQLVQRYQDAITRVTAGGPDLLTSGSASIASIGDPGAAAAMTHFGSDWLNLENLNSGGAFWPQIPTWQIIIWLRQGIVSAAQKALGVHHLAAADVPTVYKAELETDPDDPRDSVLPLTTIWVCTGNVSSAGFEVDAVRGPSTVEMVIATPPPRIPSRLWPHVVSQIDEYWGALHGDVQLPAPPSSIAPRTS